MDMENAIKVPEPYELHEKIGAGGGGTVYKAYDKNLRKTVVIKKIHDTITDEEKQRVEVDTLKNLHHQYLPQVFSYFQIDGVGYTVMDYVEGESLRSMLDRGIKFNQKKVIKYAQQLIEAVNYLHTQKNPIYHGDIKPDNIMLTSEDNICLIDFNVSGLTKEGCAYTFGFTPGYGAPEQYATYQRIQQTEGDCKQVQNAYSSGEREDVTELIPKYESDKTEILLKEEAGVKGHVEKTRSKLELSEGIVIDRQTDIYSIGATLYHLITGIRPKLGNNVNVKELVPDISDGLAYLITKAMMPARQNRYKDCDSMLKTIHQMDRLDRRYKRLTRTEYLTVFVLCMILAASIGMILKGRILIRQEKEDTYLDLVNEIKEKRITGNYGSVSELADQAIALDPENSSVYYEVALSYYEQSQYDKCISFLNDTVYSDKKIDYGQMEDSFYYLSASSYFEMEEYQKAADYYEKAVQLRPNVNKYYRDYVIALARLNRVSEAKEVLEEARKYGATADILSLLEGEIYDMEGDYTLAEKSLKECIGSTENAEILVRAYSKLDEVYERLYTGDTVYDERIALLEKAIRSVPQENSITLMQRLAQAYMDRADAQGSESDNNSAIIVLQNIRNLGYGTFQTDYNLAILYEKTGDYDKAIDWILQMIEARGEDYRWYKCLAYVELERQKERGTQERDYSRFKDYYVNMIRLYEASGNPSNDMEVEVMKQLYKDLVDQNWLD